MSLTPIAPYPKQPVTYQDYDPRAPIVAQRVSDLIRAHLPEVTCEHVGSTAIPGCGGRGAIDLLILYRDQSVEAILTGLEALGFQWVQRRNELPDEWPKGAGAIDDQGTLFRLHIMVLPREHPVVAERCAFRDRLRVDPQLRAAYMEQKHHIIASGIIEPIAYTAAKRDFVQQVMDDIAPRTSHPETSL